MNQHATTTLTLTAVVRDDVLAQRRLKIIRFTR